MSVPFVDLRQQFFDIRADVTSAVLRVLESGQFTLGAEVAGFEEDFASYCGVRYGVAVNTGTSALHLALLASEVGPGDEVITVPLTFVATTAAIVYTGARPVFVDVDPVTYTMDPKRIEQVITRRTKAILPVHLYGQSADMDLILAVARRHRLVVIEDAAQAHGATYKGQRCGSIGELGCFSFYPGKNLGAYGEGGMVTTNDANFARKIQVLRDWGAEEKYRHIVKGFNYRMEALQGAVLRAKLPYLEKWTAARRDLAFRYMETLRESDLLLPVEAPSRRHVYHVYAVLSTERQRLIEALKLRGVQTGIHYPIPVHLQPAYSDLGYQIGDFPVTEAIAAQEVSLPMFPEMTQAQMAEVSEAVLEATRVEC